MCIQHWVRKVSKPAPLALADPYHSTRQVSPKFQRQVLLLFLLLWSQEPNLLEGAAAAASRRKAVGVGVEKKCVLEMALSKSVYIIRLEILFELFGCSIKGVPKQRNLKHLKTFLKLLDNSDFFHEYITFLSYQILKEIRARTAPSSSTNSKVLDV